MRADCQFTVSELLILYHCIDARILELASEDFDADDVREELDLWFKCRLLLRAYGEAL